jgi:hypothetical protein
MVDEVLGQLSPLFEAMYATTGRPSIPPEKLLRAQLLGTGVYFNDTEGNFVGAMQPETPEKVGSSEKIVG